MKMTFSIPEMEVIRFEEGIAIDTIANSLISSESVKNESSTECPYHQG